jgi:hypothetical protein
LPGFFLNHLIFFKNRNFLKEIPVLPHGLEIWKRAKISYGRVKTMITLKQMLVRGTCTIFVLSLMGFLPGSGLITAGRAVAQDAVDIDEMLKQSPDQMPENYSDEEIDRMLEDIQQIDDSSDTEGREDSEKPEISSADRALVEDIKRNPEKYAEQIKSMVWLDARPWVIWWLCYDNVWIEAHPNFAARIYLNFDFWYRYPKIAFIIMSNRPFLIRYPRITARIYLHDDWFIEHPFVAREIYMNHIFFVRYPRFADRYYRHYQWMRGHPGVIRIAYGDQKIFKAHPQYLGNVYEYRRHAVRNQIIRKEHLPHMRDRWKNEFSHDRNRNVKTRVKYKQPDKEHGKDKTIDKKRQPDKGRTIDKTRQPDKGRTIDKTRQPDKGRTIDKTRKPDKGRTIDNRRQPDKGRTIENRRQPDNGRTIDNRRQHDNERTIDNRRQHDNSRAIDNRRLPERGRTIDNRRQPENNNGRARDNGGKVAVGQRGEGDRGRNR